MESEKLDIEQLGGNPQLWRLYMRLGHKRLDAMLYNVATDNTLVYRSYTLDNPAGKLKALEEVVYDNPTLLSDFQRIEIVVETQEFMLMPEELTDSETMRQVFNTQIPGIEGKELLTSSLHGVNAVIAWAIDPETLRFLRRTFNNPKLHHHLAPLCRYFHDNSRIGNAGKMYAHLRDGWVDIIVFGRDTMRLANSYTIHDPMDAVYYITATRNALELNLSSDELLLAGDSKTREAITPVLREYLAYVMPAIFPSVMYKAGKEALKAPFDLITMPLCV